MNAHARIIEAIETAPLNRGLRGADWLAFPGNVPVEFDNGDIALFDYEGDGAYQGHLLFKSRGRQAIEHARKAFAIMFQDHGADLLFGLVPRTAEHYRRDVALMLRWSGAKSRGIRATKNGPCELFVLSKFMWKVTQQ